jgi:spore coat protein A, manganese oxidase
MGHIVGAQPNTLNVDTLAKFVDPLPVPPIAKPSGMRTIPSSSGARLPYYRLNAQAVEMKIHRDLKPTRFWSYGSSVPGPTFEARRGEGLLVEWANELPRQHFLPIDHKLHGAEADKPHVRTVMHLHGAKVSPENDGYPDDWIVPGKSVLYRYPNEQDAAMLWYHDHAMGINRLNIYAGLFGVFIVRDKVEDELNVPGGRYEVPLVLFDRLITPDGQLYYPTSGKPEAPWVPEVFGDAILVNGKLFPYLDVEPRKYRFRLLNASNGRFYHLSLSNEVPVCQLGTDQGLLPAPVPLKTLLIAPAERADLVIDFTEHRGEQIVLKSDAFTVMQFRVSANKVDDRSSLPPRLRPVPRVPESQAVKTRLLTLDEYDNLVAEPILMLLNGTYWHKPITEKPVLNTTEIWSFLNPTDDSHPIHLHLVRFQILDRQPYEPWTYQTKQQLKFLGPPQPPAPNETGWKDTIRADPRMVTRIIVPFEGFTGRYVWHCHILEHEDNEMMRPFEIVAAS